MQKERKCTDCKKMLPLNNTHFGHARTKGFYGFTYRCKPCQRIVSKARLYHIPEHDKARSIYSRALRRGEITRLPCTKCGETKVHGHHPDYTKPLEVIWLCPKHHVETHNELRALSK